MTDNFNEAFTMIARKGIGTEVHIQPGEGYPAVEGSKKVVEKVLSLDMSPNGKFIRTYEGRVLTPENAPNIAVFVA